MQNDLILSLLIHFSAACSSRAVRRLFSVYGAAVSRTLFKPSHAKNRFFRNL
jgi:hypothetical protein